MTKGNEFQQVIWAIEDRFYEKGLLPKKSHIVERTSLKVSKVDDTLEKLLGSEQIFKIYQSPGDPNVFITKKMKNSLTAQASEPEWIENYEFEKKRELIESVSETNERISEIQTIERLLYGTGDLLENSVEYAIDYLGFDYVATEEYEDFCVEIGNHKYVIEVKGVEGQVSKSDVDQLGDWLHKKIDDGVKADDLTGILLYNHELHLDPEERGEPITDSALQFLEHQRSRHLQTKTLFEIVQGVKSEDINKSEAQDMVLEGDNNAN